MAASNWTIDDALELYNVEGWGIGYFGINAKGHVTVHPNRNPGRGLDLFELALSGCAGLGPRYFHPSDIEQARAFFDLYTRRGRSPAVGAGDLCAGERRSDRGQREQEGQDGKGCSGSHRP